MRNTLVGIIIISVLLGMLTLVALIMLVSQSRDGTTGGLRSGLWRDGKAVFSDSSLFDVFMKPYLRRGYKPKQPIHYSHLSHVDKLGIECQYCHSGVHKSPFASIPPLESCMGCHSKIKVDSPEIAQLKQYWKERIAPEWEPVSNLPEHVQFTHERHIKAGVACYVCHGQVQKMEEVERLSSFKMGFCVSCHREQGASIDCGVCHY